jgi:hypothetical protein
MRGGMDSPQFRAFARQCGRLAGLRYVDPGLRRRYTTGQSPLEIEILSGLN